MTPYENMRHVARLIIDELEYGEEQMRRYNAGQEYERYIVTYVNNMPQPYDLQRLKYAPVPWEKVMKIIDDCRAGYDHWAWDDVHNARRTNE